MTELEFMEKVLHELDTLKGIGIGLIFLAFSIIIYCIAIKK